MNRPDMPRKLCALPLPRGDAIHFHDCKRDLILPGQIAHKLEKLFS